jgi:hypothetical protein
VKGEINKDFYCSANKTVLDSKGSFVICLFSDRCNENRKNNVLYFCPLPTILFVLTLPQKLQEHDYPAKEDKYPNCK